MNNQNPFLQPGQQLPAQGSAPAAGQPFVPVPVTLRSTRDVAANGIKVLVYGFAGRGKTRLCATAPAPVIASAESGLLSMREYNLPYFEVKTYNDLLSFYMWCGNSHEARQFQTICIDSISEIAEAILESERKNSRDPRKAYGEMAIQVMELLRKFRDMPGRNVYFTSKMSRLQDQSSGGIMWGPMMPGQQVDQQLPYFTDEVFHLDVYPDGQGGKLPWLRTQPDNQYQAKDRSGALQPFEPANLSAIFDKIMRGTNYAVSV